MFGVVFFDYDAKLQKLLNLSYMINYFFEKIMAVKAPSQRRSASHCIIEHYIGVAGAVINGGRNVAPDSLGKNIAYPCIASEPLAELHD